MKRVKRLKNILPVVKNVHDFTVSNVTKEEVQQLNNLLRKLFNVSY